MREFGDLGGIVVNLRTGHLVGGPQRIKHLSPAWKISKRPVKDNVGTVAIGWIETDFGRFAYREVQWLEVKEKAANLAANKISGEWDEEKLAALLKELEGTPELALTGFSENEINRLINAYMPEHNLDDDAIPDPPAEPIAKLGDMWQLGDHRILCGDATIQSSYSRLLGDRKAQMILTDPPYGVDYAQVNESRSYKRTTHKDWSDIEADEKGNYQSALDALPHMISAMAPDGVAYIFTGTRLLNELMTWATQNKIYFPPFIVWVKGVAPITWHRYHAKHEMIFYCGPGAKPTGETSRWYGPTNETTVWEAGIDHDSLHPTQKPIAICERAIRNSTIKADLILDCFLGSGSTMIAAERAGRACYGMEIEPRYVDVAVKRWENLTGKKAQRIAMD